MGFNSGFKGLNKIQRCCKFSRMQPTVPTVASELGVGDHKKKKRMKTVPMFLSNPVHPPDLSRGKWNRSRETMSSRDCDVTQHRLLSMLITFRNDSFFSPTVKGSSTNRHFYSSHLSVFLLLQSVHNCFTYTLTNKNCIYIDIRT